MQLEEKNAKTRDFRLDTAKVRVTAVTKSRMFLDLVSSIFHSCVHLLEMLHIQGSKVNVTAEVKDHMFVNCVCFTCL